jgi:hypothetical protein
MLPAAGAELVQLHAARVVLLVLPRTVRAFLADGARQRDHWSIFGLCHVVLVSSSFAPGPPVGGHAKLGAGHRGKASAFYFSSASIVNAPVPFDTDAGDSAIHLPRA